jgi:putative transcriptional regulator
VRLSRTPRTSDRTRCFAQVSDATGIHRSTLSKILNQEGYRTGTDVLDRPCTCLGCGIADLGEHVPD